MRIFFPANSGLELLAAATSQVAVPTTVGCNPHYNYMAVQPCPSKWLRKFWNYNLLTWQISQWMIPLPVSLVAHQLWLACPGGAIFNNGRRHLQLNFSLIMRPSSELKGITSVPRGYHTTAIIGGKPWPMKTSNCLFRTLV